MLGKLMGRVKMAVSVSEFNNKVSGGPVAIDYDAKSGLVGRRFVDKDGNKLYNPSRVYTQDSVAGQQLLAEMQQQMMEAERARVEGDLYTPAHGSITSWTLPD